MEEEKNIVVTTEENIISSIKTQLEFLLLTDQSEWEKEYRSIDVLGTILGGYHFTHIMEGTDTENAKEILMTMYKVLNKYLLLLGTFQEDNNESYHNATLIYGILDKAIIRVLKKFL